MMLQSATELKGRTALTLHSQTYHTHMQRWILHVLAALQNRIVKLGA